MSNQNLPIGAEEIGKKVLIRTKHAGVHFGTLKEIRCSNGESFPVKLINTQRIYSWTGACSISQICVDGLGNNSRISVVVPSNILNAIEMIPLSNKAITSIENVGIWHIDNNGKLHK